MMLCVLDDNNRLYKAYKISSGFQRSMYDFPRLEKQILLLLGNLDPKIGSKSLKFNIKRIEI